MEIWEERMLTVKMTETKPQIPVVQNVVSFAKMSI